MFFDYNSISTQNGINREIRCIDFKINTSKCQVILEIRYLMGSTPITTGPLGTTRKINIKIDNTYKHNVVNGYSANTGTGTFALLNAIYSSGSYAYSQDHVLLQWLNAADLSGTLNN
jgi:hypothetical protein